MNGHNNSEKITIADQKLPWVDWLKGIAIIWLFIDHAVEATLGYPYLGNPDLGWPPLQQRIAQWIPLSNFGIWNIPINIWRYIGWLGDQGVSLFLVVSGFGLTWGILSKYNEKIPVLNFYKKRFVRLYPLWWGIHIFFFIVISLTGFMKIDILHDLDFYLSFLGIRILHSTFFYISPAWWYIWLLIQLYLIYPLLWNIIKKLGPVKFLTLCCIISFSIRTIVIFSGYNIDQLLYGSIFITRLPEFAFGICFAFWLQNNSEKVKGFLFSTKAIVYTFLFYILGTLLSITWSGMVVAPFIIGIGIFCFLYSVLGNKQKLFAGTHILTWTGKHSYSIYLVHHPIIEFIVPINALIGTIISIIITFIGAISLEKSVDRVLQFYKKLIENHGLKRIGIRIAIISLVLYLFAITTELLTQSYNPQEIIGWGERPSLEPDDKFGWHLIPNQTTRLRWESYDYYMTANQLGFPGPAYPENKTNNTIRIITLGDAFTSAEGVNTNLSWPRQLETFLSSSLPDKKIEVMNFAITGYGPNQYAEVAKEFVPKYHPDVIIIGFFMNDYVDVLESNDEFRSKIGFHLPPAFGLQTKLFLSHSRYVAKKSLKSFTDKIRHKQDVGEYSGLEFLFRQNEYYGKDEVYKQLARIKTIADECKSKIIIFMVPAPIQVCKPEEVNYYPRGYDLSDTTMFDFNKPQRITEKIAKKLNIDIYDLRPPFIASKECIYQPRNLHWTYAGHKVAAKYIESVLLKGNFIK